MLSRIHLRDFAIVDELELTLGRGMNVLTGETGAGKSILVGALGLVLGDRAGRGTVRAGATKADISVEMAIDGMAGVTRWLEERDLDAGETCLLRRVVTREGRSRAYINGVSCTLSALKELGERLVDIHGQHAHQSLLRRDMQRQLIDTHAGNEDLLGELGALHREWKSLGARIETLSSNSRDALERVALLRYQVEELEALGPDQQEYERLDEEHRRLSGSERLGKELYAICRMLYEGDSDSVYSRLAGAGASLRDLTGLDPTLAPSLELMDGLGVQVQELAGDLRQYLEALEADPGRLQWLDERLGAIHDLARKHRVKPRALAGLLDELRTELRTLEDPEQGLQALQARRQGVEQLAAQRCTTLSARRSRTAASLGREATRALKSLGMEGAELLIRVQAHEDRPLSPCGRDEIDFLVRTNPGQPPAPLSRVASGGELSRISLGIQMVAAQSVDIATLVFDEVDSGVGGATAEVVGRQLRALATSRQVLCVTHLPQVATQAHHHYRVHKTGAGEKVSVRIAELDAGERVAEVARMLGGMNITAQTRAHAQEMISQARDR